MRNTKHNLSSIGSQSVRALAGQSEEICVFCHTPHAATQQDQGGGALATGDWSPALWNRKIPQGSTYTPYTSNTLDAATIQAGFSGQPGGSSKLCLSCHDGTIAIGNVNVLGGASYSATPATTEVIQMQGADPDKTFPGGAYTGASGFTRDLGQTLANDHPISVTFNSALALSDGELRTPDANQSIPGTALPTGTNQAVGIRNVPPGTRPLLPQEKTGVAGTGQVQCATCHDAHIKDTAADHNIKFLRAERFQVSDPAIGGAGFKADRDIICLACHDKMGTGWAYSAHAHPSVADEKYIETGAPSPASLREFPTGRAVGFRVWEGACLNCHDTHTVQGAKKLLREGTDSIATPAKQGGNSAMEQTCYQCHSNTPAVQAGATAYDVPNIATDFGYTYKMPITGAETHDTGGSFDDSAVGGTWARCNPADTTTQCGKDLMESRANLFNRHAECTDCHNPHRVLKNRCFNGRNNVDTVNPANSCTTGSGPAIADSEGTHNHSSIHTNLASGVLSGAWGVEPVYNTNKSFHLLPDRYDAKRGPAAAGASTAVGSTYVTREYQICLKCHSDYAYTDNNIYPTGNRPNLGTSTPSGTNNLTQYTNQAKEFHAPSSHKGEVTTTDSGAAAAYSTNNHRSWHPVIDNTGRDPTTRNTSATNWLSPWNTVSAVGTQTMYCTDCHGSQNTVSTTSVAPSGSNPWGPHGSSNFFLLKGAWSSSTGTSDRSPTAGDVAANGLCFKCHSIYQYGDRNASGNSGFGNGGTNYHALHADKIQKMKCVWCHVAVPHGWKNKAFLVNLNDVGPEAGLAAGTQVRNNTTAYYNRQPYYLNALLKIRTFRRSGQWNDSDCGSSGAPGNGQSGRNWMRDSSENCANPP